MAAKELVEYVAKSLVDDPDAVKVEVVQEDGATVIELHVAEDDMGKVIGRNGSVAKALRKDGVEFETRKVPSSKKKRPEIVELTGQTRVPVLVHGEEVIHDSKRIKEYVERTWGTR